MRKNFLIFLCLQSSRNRQIKPTKQLMDDSLNLRFEQSRCRNTIQTVRFDLISVIIFIVDLKIFSSVLFPRQLLIQHFAISRSLILRIHAILQANQIRNWNQFCPRSIAFFRARRSLCVCVGGGGVTTLKFNRKAL